jgi:hypothetical protein
MSHLGPEGETGTIAAFAPLVSRRIGRVLRDAVKSGTPRAERSAALRSLLEDLTSGLEPAVIKHLQGYDCFFLFCFCFRFAICPRPVSG